MSVLIVWKLTCPWVTDPRESRSPTCVLTSEVTLLQFCSLLVSQTSPVHGGKRLTTWDINTRRQESLGVVLETGYHIWSTLPLWIHLSIFLQVWNISKRASSQSSDLNFFLLFVLFNSEITIRVLWRTARQYFIVGLSKCNSLQNRSYLTTKCKCIEKNSLGQILSNLILLALHLEFFSGVESFPFL